MIVESQQQQDSSPRPNKNTDYSRHVIDILWDKDIKKHVGEDIYYAFHRQYLNSHALHISILQYTDALILYIAALSNGTVYVLSRKSHIIAKPLI